MAMAYFQNIHSLADLKKEYRRLALQHHPDKGGDTAIMQQVNTEFENCTGYGKTNRMFQRAQPDMNMTIREPRQRNTPSTCITNTAGKAATTRGQHAPEIVETGTGMAERDLSEIQVFRQTGNCHSIHIRLMKADFEAFTKESGKVQGDINHHHIHSDKSLTDRAKDVMMNICDFIMSYNFDDSDPMTDYYHTNFYLTLGIGSYKQPYKVEPPKLDCKEKDKPEVFKHPGRSGTQGNAPGIGQSAFRLHRKPEVCRGNNSRGRPFRLAGRTLFSGRRNIQAQKWPKNASTNWRKPESNANSPAITEDTSACSGTP